MGYKVTQRMRLEADEQPVLDLRRHGFVLFEELLPPLIIWAVPAFLVFCGVALQANEDTWATGVALADIAGKVFLLASFLVLPWFGYATYDWYNDSFHVTTKRIVRYQQVFIFSQNRTEAAPDRDPKRQPEGTRRHLELARFRYGGHRDGSLQRRHRVRQDRQSADGAAEDLRAERRQAPGGRTAAGGAPSTALTIFLPTSCHCGRFTSRMAALSTTSTGGSCSRPCLCLCSC